MRIRPTDPAPLSDAEIRPLLLQLQKESVDEKLSALNWLANSKLSPDAFELADEVLSLLESHENAEVRKKAAEILAKSFTSKLKYAKALFAALDDSSDSVRANILYHFSYFSRDPIYIPEYLGALRHSRAAVRSATISHLRYGPFDSAITNEIVAAVSSQDQRLRIQAVDVLACISKQSAEQAALLKPALNSVLKDPEYAIGFTAAKTLRSFDEQNAESDRVFDAFIEADLQSDDENKRRRALWDLAHSPEGGEKYVDRLIELLDKSDSDLYNAVAALEKIGPPAHAAIPHLKRVLFTKQRVREVSKALAAIGAQDQEIIDWLVEHTLVFYPHSGGMLYCAAYGLGAFGKVSVPYLIKGLDWDNSVVQNTCTEQLCIIGKDAAEAVPHLVKLLDYGGGQPMRATCGAPPYSTLIEALVKIAPDDESVINRIRAIAQDGLDSRSSVAITALKKIGIDVPAPNVRPPRPEPADPKSAEAPIAEASQTLLDALTDPSENVRASAAASMPPEAVRSFLINLCTTQGRVRDVAFNSLEFLDQSDLTTTLLRTLPTGGPDDAVTIINRIGNDASAAVPALLRRLHEGYETHKLKLDKQYGFRSDVLDALAKIAPDDERVLECLESILDPRREHYQQFKNSMTKAAIKALTAIGSERALAIVEKSRREGV